MSVQPAATISITSTSSGKELGQTSIPIALTALSQIPASESAKKSFLDSLFEWLQSGVGKNEDELPPLPPIERPNAFAIIQNLMEAVQRPEVRVEEKKPPTPAEIKPPYNINRLRFDERDKVFRGLSTLAAGLAKKVNHSNDLPLPHKNFQGTCFMNSALQCLNNAYSSTAAVAKLIDSDLSMKDLDPFKEMEKKLSAWPSSYPNTPLDVAKFNQLELYQAQLNETKNDLSQKFLLENEIFDLKQCLCVFEDRVLFKCSMVLYMQACRHGTAQDVENALSLHYRLCYAIARHSDFQATPSQANRAMDIDSYLMLWGEMMGRMMKMTTNKGGLSLSSFHLVLKPKETFKESIKNTFACESLRFAGTPPRVITFNLNNTGLIEGKLTQAIPYDHDKSMNYMDVLDLDKARYKLTSFSFHTKTAKGAHYLCYVLKKRTKSISDWYRCDDTSIKKVDSKDVPLERACTLTFKRVSEVSID